jgi:branched-chain amino acid transport system substrate-binding protein
MIENGWPASTPRPVHLVIPAGLLVDEPNIAAWLSGRPDASKRIFAIDTRASTSANTRLAIRYNEVFTPKVTPETTSGTTYDAFYLFAYAATALGGEPLTGQNLSRAIHRLMPPGEPVDVGPSSILKAFQALRAGRSIDLGGATTTLDFDVETGDAPADIAVFCAAKPDPHGAYAPVESGVFYDPRTKQLSGSMHCP